MTQIIDVGRNQSQNTDPCHMYGFSSLKFNVHHTVKDILEGCLEVKKVEKYCSKYMLAQTFSLTV